MAHAIQNDSGFETYQATATAIAAFVRVQIDSNGLISVSDSATDWIGITQQAIAASGYGVVKLRSGSGTFQVTASAAIARGARLYPTTGGKVDDAAGTGVFTGLVAKEAATADGDVIVAVPCDPVVFTASANQAAATDATSTQTLANALRTALIAAGIIKGAA